MIRKLAVATLLFVFQGFAEEKLGLIVTVVSGEDQVRERIYTQTTPGTSNTNCTATIYTANCQTTSTPARTTNIPIQRMDVRNVVDGDDGMRYTILCSATWASSNCFPMQMAHQQFGAKVEGRTMWIFAQRGGNLGKKVRVKFSIIDLRPTPPDSPQG